MPGDTDVPQGRALGRYVLHDAISSGGMGSVHLGRLVGPVGFSRTVAIKKLHAHLVGERQFVAMFLDEARLAARIQHPNVVSTLDVVVLDGEIFLVMEYVHGESISKLMSSRELGEAEPVPPSLACAIAAGILHGLHAAHEARGAHGEELSIVHRDVSPQNVMIGADGTVRVFDFGIAKATVRLQSTAEGKVKGKIPYMAPEQLRGKKVTRTADVYSASVVLWEMLTGRRLFQADDQGALVEQVLLGLAPAISQFVAGLPAGLDELVQRGMARDPARRFATAEEMAIAIERVTVPASASEVGAWVRTRAGQRLAALAGEIARIEGAASRDAPHGLSAVFDTPKGAPPRRRWLLAAALGSATLVVAVLAASVTARSHASLATEPMAASADAGAPAVVAVVTAPLPSLNTPREPSTTAPAAASAATPRDPLPPPKRAARGTRRDCTPPYTRDSAGRVQWKVECL